jgi:hypothetical protein
LKPTGYKVKTFPAGQSMQSLSKPVIKIVGIKINKLMGENKIMYDFLSKAALLNK